MIINSKPLKWKEQRTMRKSWGNLIYLHCKMWNEEANWNGTTSVCLFGEYYKRCSNINTCSASNFGIKPGYLVSWTVLLNPFCFLHFLLKISSCFFFFGAKNPWIVPRAKILALNAFFSFAVTFVPVPFSIILVFCCLLFCSPAEL